MDVLSLVHLHRQVDDFIQGGWPRIGNQQVRDVIAQPVQEDVSKRLQQPHTAPGHNTEVHGEVHCIAAALVTYRNRGQTPCGEGREGWDSSFLFLDR